VYEWHFLFVTLLAAHNVEVSAQFETHKRIQAAGQRNIGVDPLECGGSVFVAEIFSFLFFLRHVGIILIQNVQVQIELGGAIVVDVFKVTNLNRTQCSGLIASPHHPESQLRVYLEC